MKENKDALKGKKAVKCEPIDWNDFKLGKERSDDQADANKEADEKWRVEGTVEKKRADKDFNEFIFKELSSEPEEHGKTDNSISEQEEITAGADSKTSESESELSEPAKKARKKKSLNEKLSEMGDSTWVSTGNFRNEDKLDDKTIKELEGNIIETTKGVTDEFLTSAVDEVNKALIDEDGYEPLGEISLGDTFEIPDLNIHFGDTEELRDINKISREIKDQDLKREIEKLDLAQSIELQTAKEIAEQEGLDDKVIIRSDELRKKAKKKKGTGSKKKSLEGEKTSAGKASGEKAPVKKRTEDGAPVKKSKGEKTTKSTTGKTAVKRTSEERPPVKKSSSKKAPAKKVSVEKAPVKKTSKRTSPEQAVSVKKAPVKRTSDINAKKKQVKKEGPSDFRKKSADWKDQATVDKAAKISLIREKKEALHSRIKKITPIQWSMAAMALVIFITGIMTSAVYANYQGEQNKVKALASLNQYTEDESYAEETQAVTEEMLPEAAEEPESVQAKALSLEMSSVEKDLKIKLVDEEDKLVRDVPWSVTVSKEAEDGEDTADSEEYEDDDEDGIIYINDIAAGEYAVKLNPSDSLADYVLPQEKQLVSVKATIEYKVITNIRDEIKSEKEVNVALEDPNGNQAADVETGAAIADTVEWCESTKIENGEQYVEATPDLSKTAVSMKKDTGLFAALKRIGNNTSASVSNRSVFGFSMPVGYKVATADEELVTIEEPKEEEPEKPSEQEPEESVIKEMSLSISCDRKTINIGETAKLKLEANYELKDDDIRWEADDMLIVQMESGGTSCKVTGSKPGSVKIRAYAGSLSAEVTITVKQEDDLSISGSDSVDVGSNITLTAAFNPSDASVTWSVSDSSIASIAATEDSGRKCSIKGEKSGSVTVTASCSNGKSTSMTITVKAVEGKYSDDAKLYDASKNPLYVKDGDSYRLATYGDYRGGLFSIFYRKETGYLYTGWQNIDGKTYYYRSDHTYVTGDQVIQGIQYSFGADGALATGSGTLGIDVSKYQPNINWSAVKASGVNYVIIRCGYRGASTGVLIQDPYFVSHIKGAKAAGLKVGVYFFTTALTEAEAVEEASMCAALCSGYGINYPIFIDCENSSRPGYNSMSASERTTIIKAFCNTIKSAGYTPGVYANKTWLTSYINTSALSGCKIWLAQYNSSGPTYSGRYDLWQYTSKGHVDGISGNVDMNQSYLGY
ncbi:MAG: Ig-like domain-containing protein [Lachnospiraceae bacterium]|nr:Ig-like domain-containing protein [Lachnospiraceae bacterium]